MRRRPPNDSNSSTRTRRRHVAWYCGLCLLLYALYRAFTLHGDLQQQGGSTNGGAAAAAAADVQVIMPEEEDATYLSLASKDLQQLLKYPHIDECRQCSVCIPQAVIDEKLGNSSSRSWWGRLWGRRQLLQEQQWLQEQLSPSQEQFLNSHINSSSTFSSSNSSRSSSAKRQRESWVQRQQQWLAALAAAGDTAGDTASLNSSSSRSDSSGDSSSSSSAWGPAWVSKALQHVLYSKQQQQAQQQQQQPRQQQQQQQQQQRRLLEEEEHPPALPPRLPPQLPQQQPKLDGVKTHKEWLAKEAAGEVSSDTHAVPGVEVIIAMPDNAFEWQGQRYHIGPGSLQMDQSKIRHCSVCRGCKQRLRLMPKGITWLGGAFLHDPGASDGWLSTAESSSEHERSVVKVWCVPVPKPGTHVPAVCKPSAIREQLQLVLALQNIAQDCGLGELLPHTWVGPVDGVLPGSGGYRVLWDGLWSRLVVGVSAENLVHRGAPRVQPPLLLQYLQHEVNSTQILMAAVFDLLFSQCDRHGQNLYLKPDGSIVLIDNDQSYGASWRPCGVDSLFLPGTQKFEVERLGFSYVMKKPEYAPPKAPAARLDPLQLLDYRCHLPKGQTALGTHYPKPVTQCLKRLSKSTPEAIASKYGYPNTRMAAAVHQRAQDMLHRGFEWTLQHGWPRNPVPMRYRWSKGCCKMRWKQGEVADSSSSDSSSSGSSSPQTPGVYECTQWVAEELGWETALPVGDPVAGTAWEHNAVDSGSYDLTEGVDVVQPM